MVRQGLLSNSPLFYLLRYLLEYNNLYRDRFVCLFFQPPTPSTSNNGHDRPERVFSQSHVVTRTCHTKELDMGDTHVHERACVYICACVHVDGSERREGRKVRTHRHRSSKGPDISVSMDTGTYRSD